MKRALASDFDNTLFFRDTEERFRAQDIFDIMFFQKSGGIFGICTGRSPDSVLETIGTFIRPDFIIAASGSKASKVRGVCRGVSGISGSGITGSGVGLSLTEQAVKLIDTIIANRMMPAAITMFRILLRFISGYINYSSLSYINSHYVKEA